MLMPEHAGRCPKPAQDRGPELRDECPILALDPLAALDGLKRDDVGIDELAIARVTDGRHGHAHACRSWTRGPPNDSRYH